MSGKIKKLICAILTGTMLLSSASMLVFADEPNTSADTTVTNTAADAEATEAPAAETTPAPAVSTGTKYDSDAYYQKALALCQGLGVIKGDDKGNVNPQDNVKRSEMAAIILRTLNQTTTSSYQNIFTDVDASHWAANTIQTASAFGIINGMGDGTFNPDGDVTYEQVAKMIVCAMNYHETAEYYGGYPTGFLKVAADLGITKNAVGSTGVAAERGVVIKMIYNALLTDYNEPDGSEYGQSKYTAYRTLAEYAFDVKEATGLLMGTEITSLTGDDYSKGQVGIIVNNANGTTSQKTFSTVLTGLESMLASNITFYYEETAGNDVLTLLAIAENTSKTESVSLDRDDVEDIEDVTGFDNSAVEGTIKVHGRTTYKIEANPTVIYNGTLVTYKDFTDAQAANTKKDDTRLYKDGNAVDYNDFLTPQVGTIRLVDNDMNGKYDTVFVDSYETLLVVSASNKIVSGKINAKDVKISVDQDEKDLTISTTINNMEAAPRNLKKNNVVSLKRSLDNETLEFTCTGESLTGSIQSISNDDDMTIVNIAGTEYEVDANAVSNCKVGSQAIFYTDMFGRIGYIDGASAGRLQSGEKYGWLMNAYTSDNKEDVMITIMTQEGKAQDFRFANTVAYWAPDSLEAESLSKSAAETKIANLIANDGFSHMWKGTRHTDGTTADGERRYSWEKSNAIRLVKYRANSLGEISKLYTAINVVNEAEKYYSETSDYVKDKKNITDPYIPAADIQNLKNSDALIYDMTNKSGSTLAGGMTGGYYITDDMIEFSVPNTPANATKASAYKVKNVTASTYNQRENGVSDDWIVADMDGTAPAVLIKFVADTTKPGVASAMDNVANTSAMVVEKILSGMDEDENRVYEIVGQVSGSSMSVKTNSASTMAELLKYAGDSRTYEVGETLWDAEMDKSLTEVLHKGDIIISDGTNILLYACVQDVYAKMNAGTSISKYVTGSNTRNYFKFDRVSDYELDDPSRLTIGNDSMSFDASKAMTTVEIDLSRPVGSAVTILKDVSTVSDLSTDGSEYAFARFANKGELQEIIIYRFLNMPEDE